MPELDFISVRGVRRGGLASVAATLALTTAASASVVNYTDRDAFLAAAGPVNSIGVPDMPAGWPGSWAVPLGLDMSGTGMHGGPLWPEFASYWGVPQGTNVLIGPTTSTWQFSAPYATAFALNALFLVPVSAYVFHGYTFLGSVSWGGMAEGDYAPRFRGLVSTTPFTRVVITDLPGTDAPVFVHTLMFSVIPTPGAGLMLALAALAPRRRR